VGENFVTCRLCGEDFGQITTTHLDKEHGITMFEYRKDFPDAVLVTGKHIEVATSNLWNHSGVGSTPEREVERREAISKSHLGKVFSEEHCRHLSERTTGWQSTKESREANSKGMLAWWSVPENKEIRIRQIRQGSSSRPNEVEGVLEWYLDYLYPGEWKYNDGWLVVGGKIPDFANVNGQKKLIELFGDYWHGIDITDKTEEERVSLFNGFGYKTLVVWECEVYYGNSELVSKLREFCANVL